MEYLKGKYLKGTPPPSKRHKNKVLMTPTLLANRREPHQRERWLNKLLAEDVISTPALVIDSSEVRSTLDLFNQYLPEAQIFYAVKANNSQALLQYLSEQGTSFDVASIQEINELRAVGVAPHRMIFSNPVKSPAAINAFFDHGLKLLTIDNEYDLSALEQTRLRRGLKSDVGVFVRIRIATTDIQIDLNSKFGCFEHEAIALIKASADAGFIPRGIQFHVGTQSWNTHNFRIGIETSLRVFDAVEQKYGIRCDTINIGGGYPDPVLAKEAGGIDRFFTDLIDALAPALDRGIKLIAEPGRIIVSGACSAVCTVIGKSVRNGTPWLYLDDGAYGLFSGKFFDHKEFHFRVLRQSSDVRGAPYIPYVVAGPTCDSLDIISQPTLLPPDLNPGDVLCCHNMGAYSLVTACAFNGFGKINTYLGAPVKPLTASVEVEQSSVVVGSIPSEETVKSRKVRSLRKVQNG